MSFLGEIKRRKVFQVAAVYAVVAWLIIQVVGQVSDPLNLPDWFDTVAIVFLAIGFPIALILGWAFDFTARGIEATPPAEERKRVVQPPGAAVSYVIQGLVLLAVGFLVVDQFVLGNRGQPNDVSLDTRRAQLGSGPLMRLAATLPDGVRYATGEVFLQGATISPDGQYLAFTGVDESSGQSRVYVRPLDSVEVMPIEGSEDANSIFWSPDSRQLGFFAEGRLKIASITSGVAQPVARATGSTGATWNEQDVILASLDNPGPLYRVYLEGSTPTPVTELDRESETDHLWPQFLEDGDRFLYMATGLSVAENTVYVASLESNDRTPLIKGVNAFNYAAPNSVLFFRDGILQAQDFDPETFRLIGQPIPLATDAQPPVSASRTGAVTYRTVPTDPVSMTWIRTDGSEIKPALPAGYYADPDISPDGQKIVFARRPPTSGAYDIWILDSEDGVPRQLTTHPGNDRAPLWSPDGRSIAFLSFREGAPGLYVRDASGIGTEQLILPSPGVLWPYQWPETDKLLYFAGSSGANDVWMIAPRQPENRTLLVGGQFNEADAALSPAGEWLVYSSNDTGRYELFLTSFPPDATQIQLTTDGGVDPTWSPDGSRLYYIRPSTGSLMARPVTTGVPPQFGEPGLVHPGPFFYPDAHSFALNPQRDEILLSPSFGFSGDITILLNWQNQNQAAN